MVHGIIIALLLLPPWGLLGVEIAGATASALKRGRGSRTHQAERPLGISAQALLEVRLPRAGEPAPYPGLGPRSCRVCEPSGRAAGRISGSRRGIARPLREM